MPEYILPKNNLKWRLLQQNQKIAHFAHHWSPKKGSSGTYLWKKNTNNWKFIPPQHLEPKLRSNHLANLLKTYQNDLGSSKLYYWYTAAAARQMWRRIRFSIYWTELFKDPKKLFVRDSQQLHKKFIWTILLTVSLSFWKFATLFKRVKNGKC